MDKDPNRPIVKGDRMEAINCYAYIINKNISKLACQRAIWNIFEIEVDGYDHKKDKQF